MKIKLTGTVLHDGREYAPGNYLTCSDEDAKSLIRSRIAVEVPEEKKTSPAPLSSEPKRQEAKKPEPEPEEKKPELKKPKSKNK